MLNPSCICLVSDYTRVAMHETQLKMIIITLGVARDLIFCAKQAILAHLPRSLLIGCLLQTEGLRIRCVGVLCQQSQLLHVYCVCTHRHTCCLFGVNMFNEGDFLSQLSDRFLLLSFFVSLWKMFFIHTCTQMYVCRWMLGLCQEERARVRDRKNEGEVICAWQRLGCICSVWHTVLSLQQLGHSLGTCAKGQNSLSVSCLLLNADWQLGFFVCVCVYVSHLCYSTRTCVSNWQAGRNTPHIAGRQM